jgi:hypothetical protein
MMTGQEGVPPVCVFAGVGHAEEEGRVVLQFEILILEFLAVYRLTAFR